MVDVNRQEIDKSGQGIIQHDPIGQRLDELLINQRFRNQVEEMVLDQLGRGETHTPINGVSHSSYQSSVIPISDIRGVESLNYRKDEKILRCKLASCYRLLETSLSEGNRTYISVRNGPGQMLIAPEGLLYSEITASSLVKIDTNNGRVLDDGSTSFDVCHDEVSLHLTLYAARNNINSIIHIGTPAVVTVSIMKSGLLPLSYEAMVLGDIAYHDFSGSVGNQAEAESIKQSLSESCQVLFLRSFGVVVMGETIEEMYKTASNVLTATETQVNLIPIGIDNMHLPTHETLNTVYNMERDVPTGADMSKQWKYGEVEFEGLMRILDSQGYCTGYSYPDRIQTQRSVSVTDSASGRLSSLEGRMSTIATPLNQLLMRGRRPEAIVSPNVYWKEEADFVDSATMGSSKGKSKKLYRWVSSEAISNNRPKLHHTSMKNLCPNMYAPQGSNPNELREKVKEIRKEYFDDTITAGPQSTVLEGITWEEARRIKEGQMINGVSNVRVTAASRGVIQREHQGEALFYKNYTLNNPFEHVTQEDLEKYKREVQTKSSRGYGKYAESEPELLSERYPLSPVRALTPPAKPARMSPTENELQYYNRQQIKSDTINEPDIRASVSKPVSASQPQPRIALSTQNQSDYVNDSELLEVPTDRSGTLDSRSSKENSPYGSLKQDKKKKRGLRLPSFSKKKDKQ